MLRPILLASLLPLGLGSAALAAPAAQIPAPLLADGTTATEVVLSVPGLRPGDPVRASSDTARVDALRVVAPGVLVATVLPDATAATGRLIIAVRGKGAVGKISADLAVPIRGGLAAAISPLARPSGTTPGGAAVDLGLRLPETVQVDETRRVLGRASIGSLGAPERTGVGTWEVRWTPPATASGSQIAVLSFADAAAPGRVVGAVAVPLLAEASLTLDAPADSQNTLMHGGLTLGPVKASPAGTVAFTIAVDPRAPQATLQTTTPDGRVRTRTVELETADATTLAFVPGPDTLVADPGQPTDLLVAHLDARGAPVTDRPPRLGASRGAVGVARAAGVPGIWLAPFTPPDAPGSVTFTAESGGSTIERRVTLVAAPPTMRLAPSVAPLPHDARSLSVTVSGGGGGAPALEARGGRLGSRPRGTPGGTTFVVTPASDADGIWLLAAPPRGERGGAPAHATVTGPDAAPDSGPRPYTVRLVDAAGLPVADAPLSVTAGWTDELDAPDQTDAQGLARIWLTPPDDGAESLVVRVGGVPAGAVLGPALEAVPTSGFAPTTWVAREAPPVVVAAAPAPAPAEPVAAEQEADPLVAPPDGAPPDSDPADSDPVATGPAPGTSPDRAVPWLRIGLGGGMGGHDWAQDADDGVAGPEDDTTTAGSLPLGLGAAAVGLHGQAWFGDGPVGLDLDLVGQGGRFSGEDSRTLRGGLGVQGRLRLGGALGLYAHLGAGRTPGFLVVYEDGDPEEETGVTQRVLGGQLGAGLLVDTPRVHVDLGVRELWAPWPVQTLGRLDVGVAVAEHLSVDLRTGYAARTMAYEVDGEAIDTDDSLAYVGLGLSFLAR